MKKIDKRSLTFLIFTISFVLFMMVFMRVDSDYLWHIKAGEYMFLNHTILTHDVFSWIAIGSYWMSHEWGFEVIIYVLSLMFGKYHLFVYGFSCLLILYLILFKINIDKYNNNKLFAIIWLFAGIIFAPFMTGRPHLISNIFILLTCYFSLELFNNKDSKKIYFLPLIALFWSNIHGGSSNLVYLIPMIFLIAGVFKFNFEKVYSERLVKKQFITYLVIIIISILCISINPHGIKMIIYPYENIMNSTMVSTIIEWGSTQLSNTSHWIYFLLSFVILLIFILSKKKIRFIDGLLFLFCLVLGLKSIRFWSYTYIIMSLIVFDYIPYRKDDKGTNILSLFVSFLLLFIFVYSFNKNIMVVTTKKELSNKFINTIKRENPKRLYNEYGIGGELIYNDIDVFIDGRADLYSKINYDDVLTITFLTDDFKKKIKKYNFDYYVVNKGRPLYFYLKDNDLYKKIYKENDYVIYKKKY